MVIAYLCFIMADQFIIEVTDPTQIKFVEELLAHFDFVKFKRASKPKVLKKTKVEKEFQESLKRSFKEIEDDISGKRKMPTLKEALNGL